MKNSFSIKKTLYFFTLLICSFTHSQIINKEIEEPNYRKSSVVFFYKNTLKPFTGNIKIETKFKSQLDSLKVKFKNGFAIVQEFTNIKSKKIVLRITQEEYNNNEKYDSINLKTVFANSDVFIDTSRVQKKRVNNYFHVNNDNKKVEKLNGFIKYEKTKLYFSNGMKVKVEYFYDEDLKKIKESYEIFTTVIGNIENGDFEDYKKNFTFNGEYKKWNAEGTLIEKGRYKEGIKE